jgi:CheY-like chemotaxis protein
MEESLPSPPRTVIVVADTPINLSFIRSVLDAHVLPYEVQVIDRGDPALDLLKHLTQHESRQAPTVILLDRTRPQRDGNALVRGLKTRWPSLLLQRVMRALDTASPSRAPQHTAPPTVAMRPGLGYWPRAPRRPRVGCVIALAVGSATARVSQSTATQRPRGRGTPRGRRASTVACR